MLEKNTRFQLVSTLPGANGSLETSRHLIIDWVQRRWYTVEGPSECFPSNIWPSEINDSDGEDQQRQERGQDAIDVLAHYQHFLAPEVNVITFDTKGRLRAVSAMSTVDLELRAYQLHTTDYPPFISAPSLQGSTTISYSRLAEVKWLAPAVDLMCLKDAPSKQFAFKYFLDNDKRKTIWKEMHILQSIPPHPSVLPLEHIVVDDSEFRILGFTTKFVTGGCFLTRNRPFKLKWLKQLIDVVDFLNLDRRLLHGDIHPGNIVVDDETDRLTLLDFGWAEYLDSRRVRSPKDDIRNVVLTMYELAADDETVWEDDDEGAEGLLERKPWPVVEGRLACREVTFRKCLRDWYHRRKELLRKKPPPLPQKGVSGWPEEPPRGLNVAGQKLSRKSAYLDNGPRRFLCERLLDEEANSHRRKKRKLSAANRDQPDDDANVA